MIDSAAGTAADLGTGRPESGQDEAESAAMAPMLHIAFEYSATPTLLADSEHVILGANRAAHQLLHATSGALAGRSLDEFCPTDWASRADKQMLARPAEKQQLGENDVRLVTAAGSSRTAHMHIAVVPKRESPLRFLVQFYPASSVGSINGHYLDETQTDTGESSRSEGGGRPTRPPRPPLTVEQQALLDQLAIVEARERTRMAEVIHDEPIQLVVAAMMRIDNLRQRLEAPEADELDESANLLEGAVDRLRDLIVIALTPPDLSDGLGIALQDLADGIFAATPTRFSVVGSEHAHLAPSIQSAVYNILRDTMVAIRNAGRAQRVILDITDSQGTLDFDLIDDSKASILDPRGTGCDLVTLRARAAAIGGELTLRANTPQGATLVLTLPRPSAAS